MRPFALRHSALRRTARPSVPALAPSCRFARAYSIKLEAATSAKQQGLDAKRLSIQKSTKPKALLKPEDLVFGQNLTGAWTIALLMYYNVDI
jgi:branched-chain amino acid aminotransferase